MLSEVNLILTDPHFDLQTKVDELLATNSFIHNAKSNTTLLIESDLAYLKFEDGTIIHFDFEKRLAELKRQKGMSPGPLLKAMTLSSTENPLILDLTCGTGADSLFLSYWGKKVISYERHPLIYLLIYSALLRSRFPFQCFFGEAKSNLETTPDIIYYDPMYPSVKKSALSRKEMEAFKILTGGDLDEMETLSWAMTRAKSRIVVKRPLQSGPILKNVNYQLMGKSVRFDIYLPLSV